MAHSSPEWTHTYYVHSGELVPRKRASVSTGARRLFRVSNPWLHRSRFVAFDEGQLRRLVGRIWPGEPLIIETDR